jgi:Neuraminidase (sialidase)
MGNFHKTVTVNSNATNKTVVLTIKGQVMNPAAQKTTPTKQGGSVIAK